MIVQLTPQSEIALQTVSLLSGRTQTDAMNYAIQLYDRLCEALYSDGLKVVLLNSDGSVEEVDIQ